MVAEFLRLRLRLLGNTFKRPASQRLWSVVGVLFAIVLTVIVISELFALRGGDPVLGRNIVVIGGAIVVTGFFVVPLLFSVDDTMDPRSFSLYGLRDDALALGLGVAAFIGVSAVAVTLASLATIVTWSQSPGSTLLALIAAIVGAATCVLGARIATAVAGSALATRRAREIGVTVGVLIIILIGPAILLLALSDWGGNGFFDALEGVLGWTPLGAVWAVPADAANGQWVFAVLKLLIALATLALLWLGWKGLVAYMLVSPGRQLDLHEPGGLGWFGRTPTTRTGAVAARSLTYWGRDARYYAQLVIVPVVPVVAVLVFVFVGIPIGYAALLPIPLVCLFLGWVVHNDVAFDNTAIWLHVVAGKVGVADRIGRMIPVVIIAIPFIGIGSFLSVVFAGNLDALPAVLGTSTCLVLCGLGLGSIFSARFPYPSTRPGDSPFMQPQSTGAVSALAQGFSLGGTLILSTPSIVFGIRGVVGVPGDYWISLWTGVVVGVVVLVVGIMWGARLFNSRGPEILASAQRN
jgi:ABC-2 type transport system permease protein